MLGVRFKSVSLVDKITRKYLVGSVKLTEKNYSNPAFNVGSILHNISALCETNYTHGPPKDSKGNVSYFKLCPTNIFNSK